MSTCTVCLLVIFPIRSIQVDELLLFPVVLDVIDVLFVCFALIWLNWLCLDYLAVIFTLFDSTWVVFLDRYSAHWAFDWFDLFCLGLLLSDLLVFFCLLVIYFHFVWLKLLYFNCLLTHLLFTRRFLFFCSTFLSSSSSSYYCYWFYLLAWLWFDLIWFDLFCIWLICLVLITIPTLYFGFILVFCWLLLMLILFWV